MLNILVKIMRWIVDYFRSLFCNHEWEHFKEVQYYETHDTTYSLPVRRKQIFICTKCLTKKEINY